MRVFVVNAYCAPYAPGGAEYSMAALVEQLSRTTVTPVVVTPNYGEPPHVGDGADLISIESPFRLPPGQLIDCGDWHRSPDFIERMASAIAAKWHEGDLVHLQGAPVIPVGERLQRQGIGPIVLTIRDTALLCPSGYCLMDPVFFSSPHACRTWGEQVRCAWRFTKGQTVRSPLWRRLKGQPRHWAAWRRAIGLRKVANRFDSLVTVSEGFARLLRANGVGTPTTLHAIYNLAPEPTVATSAEIEELRQRLGIARERSIVLIVGKRSLGKGTRVAWNALAKLAADGVDAVALSVGKGAELPTERFWINHPPVSQKTLAALYHMAAVVVVPSLWPEPFSRVLLEAMAYGKPLIGSTTGGTPEAIQEGENGWLIPPNDADALAAALLKALSLSAAELAKIGEGGRRLLAQKFDRERSLRALIDLYSQLIEHRRTRSIHV